MKLDYILDLIHFDFFEIAKSAHGTRVIQKIIECLANDFIKNKFCTIFGSLLLHICKDINANHIVLKFVKVVKYPHNQFVYDILLDNLYEIATDKHGCCVMQKCIGDGNEMQRVKYFN